MRKLFVIGLLVVMSCTQKSSENTGDFSLDTTLINSEKNLEKSLEIEKKSDSVTKQQVVKIVKEFTVLTKEIEKFKTEKLIMLNELKLSKENFIVRVDTVYIETKKNFWGKEKSTTKVKSDSTIITSLDTTLSTTEIVDTTTNN